MLTDGILFVLASYLAFGLVFATGFVIFGVQRTDVHGFTGTRGFRLLILPGVAALWPLWLRRWFQAVYRRPNQTPPPPPHA